MIADAFAFLRTRTGQIGAIVIAVLVGFGLWLHFHDRGVIRRETEKIQAKAVPANEKAAERRVEDTTKIATQAQEVKDALKPLPDAALSDRRRVYACTVWMQQHPGAPTPAACGSGANSKASDAH